MSSFILWSQPTSVVLVAAPLITVVTAFLIKGSRAVAVVTLMNFPYAMGAFLGAKNGITFFPRPALSVYESVAHEQTLTLFSAFGITMALGVAQCFQNALAAGWAWLTASRVGAVDVLRGRFGLVFSIALLVGLHDAVFLVLNLGAVVNSSRHSFRQEFWVGNGPLGIGLALVVGLILIVLAIGAREYRGRSVFGMILFWTPSLIAGSRNYFSVLMLAALCAAFFAISNWKVKTSVAVVAILGISGFTLLPGLWSDNDLVGFNEWILPTSSYLPLVGGMYTIESIGATPLLHQWALLLPSPLRPFQVELYAEVFAQARFTNVGVAGNPWADSFDAELSSRVAVFTLTFGGVFLLAVGARKIHPLVPYLAFGLMAFWGRSVFWNTAVVIVYAALLLRLLLPLRFNSGRAI
ncbi:hypothetical protein V1639_04200 [Pseudarthrobacter sp. J75]|uniref:hypothetical protein n=1 Tax=Pseudarthrobacter sp. J75 TaxID=3116486 RepID=UPI002E80A42E|nr:hypothetical protein [Pseudarthrobacter sp. J75]MEE2528234.1 hypothetical protein [Pseudarthrobacter sp. J75]